MDQFSCSAEILIVYAPRKFLDNHFMIVRGRAEPRHRADVRVMNVFTLMTPTLCTARRSEKHPTGPTSNLHQFLCARILAHPKFRPEPKHSVTQIRDTTLRAVCTTDLRLRFPPELVAQLRRGRGWLVYYYLFIFYFSYVLILFIYFLFAVTLMLRARSCQSWGEPSLTGPKRIWERWLGETRRYAQIMYSALKKGKIWENGQKAIFLEFRVFAPWAKGVPWDGQKRPFLGGKGGGAGGGVLGLRRHIYTLSRGKWGGRGGEGWGVKKGLREISGREGGGLAGGRVGPRGDPQIRQNPKRSGVTNFDENESGGVFGHFSKNGQKSQNG